jgi:hypothetical protein
LDSQGDGHRYLIRERIGSDGVNEAASKTAASFASETPTEKTMRLVALKRIEATNNKGQVVVRAPGVCFDETDKDTINRLKNTFAANPAKESDEARAKEQGLKEKILPGRVRSLRERRARQLASEEMGERAESIQANKDLKTASTENPADQNNPGSNDGSDGSNTAETSPGGGAGMDTTKLSQSTGTSRQGSTTTGNKGRNQNLV